MVKAQSSVLSTGTTAPLKGIRKVAARRMVQAWAAPVFHLSTEIKMERALVASKFEPGLTVTDILLHAVTKALQENPALNALFDEESVTTYTEVNLGIAVATEHGLVVPVVHAIEVDSISEIAKKRSAAVTKARDGKLQMVDIEGATFTISNLGMLGIDSFDAIINPPQVGILAIGSTKEIAVVEESKIVIRKSATFTLTCDHRAIDGATGAKFLTSLRTSLEGY